MMIRRTVSSYSSQHLFYKAQIIVYCEGGPSKTYDEAIRADLPTRTLDGTYWSQVVSFLGIKKTYHIKSIGSKTTLRQIAADVQESGVQNVTICFDGDYDIILGVFQGTTRTATTFGYSWESDVLSVEVLPRILTHLVGSPTPAMLAKLTSDVDAFKNDLRLWCEIDISLRSRQMKCIFDREKPTSGLDFNSNPMTISSSRLQRRLREIGYKRRPRRVFDCASADILNICYGKIVAYAIYHIVFGIATQLVSNLSVSYDNFMRIAIAETFNLLKSGQLSNMAGHHIRQGHVF